MSDGRPTTLVKQFGCAAVFIVIVACLVLAFRRTLLVLGAIAVVAIATSLAHQAWKRRRLVRRFRREHGVLGKDLLIVCTDSPHWLPYIEAQWLPRWGNRAVVFNRTLPWKKEQLEAELWRAFSGSRDHTPLALVIPSHGAVTVVRFWQAFLDLKHGKDSELRNAEAALELGLLRSTRP